MVRNIIGVFLCALFSACAPMVAVKKGYDFSQIKKVAILQFDGKSMSGSAITDEFIRQLMQAGIDVVERQHIEKLLQEQNLSYSATSEDFKNAAHLMGVDAFFTGTVTLYQPDQRFLVTLNDSDTMIAQPVIQMQSSRYYRKDEYVDEDSYVLFVGAVVSVSARLIDVRTGAVVWADNSTYEALSADHALSSVVRYFLKSLKPYLTL